MKLLSAIIASLLFSVPALAHFFVEPDLGLEAGKSKQSFVSTNSPTVTSDYNQNGITYGLSGGYRYNRYFLGAEYEKCLGANVTDISGFAGLNIALRVRVWFSYIFSSKDNVSSGSGYKIGIGVALVKLFILNAEYAARTYNKYTGSAAYTGLNYSGSTNTIKVTFSLPIPRLPF